MSEICLEISFQRKQYNSFFILGEYGKILVIYGMINSSFSENKEMISWLATEVAFNIYTTAEFFSFICKNNLTFR